MFQLEEEMEDNEQCVQTEIITCDDESYILDDDHYVVMNDHTYISHNDKEEEILDMGITNLNIQIEALTNKNTKEKCTKCRQTFASQEDLAAHQILRHVPKTSSPKRHNCSHCHQDFASKSSLYKHVQTHLDEKTHHCKICDRYFSQLANLQRHEVVHTGEKPFSCPVCHKNFTQRSNVTKHLLTHRNLKPFECLLCNKSFTQRANLKKHELLHSAMRPYECTICGKGYTQLANVKKHMRTHQLRSQAIQTDGEDAKTEAVTIKSESDKKHLTPTNKSATVLTDCKQFLSFHCSNCSQLFQSNELFESHLNECIKCEDDLDFELDFKAAGLITSEDENDLV